MYEALTFYHSLFRWLVLASMLITIYRAFTGFRSNRTFSSLDNSLRHWTATIAHIQLIIGFIFYIKSPVTAYFWESPGKSMSDVELVFFGIIHIALMLTAIVILTIGSAKAKRRPTDRDKFKTILVWFSVALLIIFIAIPWPFSPLASRPYFR